MHTERHRTLGSAPRGARAFATLVARYLPAVEAACFGRLGNRTDAHRAATAAFARLRVRRNAADGDILALLAASTAEACEAPQDWPPPLTDARLPSDYLEHRQRLLSLDRDAREIILLRHAGDLRPAEIARWTGTDAAEVPHTLAKAQAAFGVKDLASIRAAVAPGGSTRDRVAAVLSALGLPGPVPAVGRRRWAQGLAVTAWAAAIAAVLAVGALWWMGVAAGPAPNAASTASTAPARPVAMAPAPPSPTLAPSRLPASSTDRGAIEGRVTDDATGLPVEVFEVAHPNDVGVEGAPPFLAVADGAGRFYLGDVDPGEATVAVRATGYAPATQTVRVRDLSQQGPATVTVRLQRLATLTAVVLDEDDRPVTGAEVYRDEVPPAYRRAGLEVARTDEEGVFRLEGLAPGPHRLALFHPDHVGLSLLVEPRPGESLRERLVLSRGAAISGRIGGPVAGHARIVLTEKGFGSFRSETLVDDDGAYRLSGVPAGEYDLRAEDGSGRAVVRTVSVGRGATVPVDFRIEAPSATLEGLVTAEGDAPQTGSVELRIATEAGVEHWGPYPVEGSRFRAGPLPPGTASVDVFVVSQSSRTRRRAVAVELRPGEAHEVEVALQGQTTVRGTLAGLDEDRYARLYAFPAGTEERPADLDTLKRLGQRAAARLFTRRDGDFHLTGLDRGRYTLLAVAMAEETPEGFRQAKIASATVDLPQAADEPVELIFD